MLDRRHDGPVSLMGPEDAVVQSLVGYLRGEIVRRSVVPPGLEERESWTGCSIPGVPPGLSSDAPPGLNHPLPVERDTRG